MILSISSIALVNDSDTVRFMGNSVISRHEEQTEMNQTERRTSTTTVLFNVCSSVTVECCILYPCCVGVVGMFAVM